LLRPGWVGWGLEPVNHQRTKYHLQLFCGVGGLSAGISDGGPVHHSGLVGRWECIGAFDNNPRTVAEYNRYNSSVGKVVDFFTREQYRAYWGKEPPDGWRELTPQGLRELCGDRTPDLVASSPPCKGYSSLLGEELSRSAKYQALNQLVYHAIWLGLEAFQDDPPGIWLLENVPRITSRGADYLHDVRGLLECYGYSVTGDAHCCGRLGGLAQRRRRFLLTARHREKVPAFLYRPPIRPYRTVGEVIGAFPMPGDPRGGALHAPRRVTFRTATRLSLIPPGKDWRALRELRVEGGVLADYVMLPQRYGHAGALGVQPWDEPARAVTGESTPTNGRFAVADPRTAELRRGTYGVRGGWDQPGATVTTRGTSSTGAHSVADPRPAWGREFGQLGVLGWQEVAGTIRTQSAAAQGRHAIADPRIAGATAGALAVADPMVGWMHGKAEGRWDKGGHYGVVPLDGLSSTVTASASVDSGRWAVADDRLPDPEDLGVWVIVSPWGFWHRGFTTLELAALQGLITPEDLPALGEEPELPGPAALIASAESDTFLRQLIGNAVPRPAAAAIGRVVMKTLLAADAGETFTLSNLEPWCAPKMVAVQLSLDQ